MMNQKTQRLEQELTSSNGPFSLKAFVVFKRPAAVQEEQKVTVPSEKSTKPAFLLSAQLGLLCWVVKAQTLICQRTLAEEISADNNGGPKRRLVV